ncbi:MULTISPECIES: transposase [Rhodococcus]|uniref:transposase n=1 Tax=Rhodococcus TaxID=1827 RepID=UPI003557E242
MWSSNHARHRLSRTGNRQLNAAIHRIALTQARCHEDARALLARRKARRRRWYGSAPRPQTPIVGRRLPSDDRRPIITYGRCCLTEELETVPGGSGLSQYRSPVKQVPLQY